MHLIKQDVVSMCAVSVANFCNMTGIPPERIYDSGAILPTLPERLRVPYTMTVDSQATGILALRAETFIFSSAYILDFLRKIDTEMNAVDYPIPFLNMIIQFTEPINEKLFLSGLMTGGDDPIINDPNLTGLLISFPQAGSRVINIVALYEKGSLNRVVADGSTGEIVWTLLLDEDNITSTMRQDKQRLYNLAMLCVAYISSPKVTVEKITTEKSVNEKRVKKGKKPLLDYYICKWETERPVYPAKGQTGRKVSFEFPVRGHWRQLSSGQRVRVKPHFRGVEHGPDSRRTRITVVDDAT